jgi:hypothetical protein
MPTIAENLQRLVDAKTDIASAITAKGGTVNTGDGFEEFASAIAGIPEGTEILDLTTSDSNVTHNNLHATYHGDTLFIFGSFRSISSNDVEFTFPKSLQDIGVITNKTGTLLSAHKSGSAIQGYVLSQTIQPTSTTITIRSSASYVNSVIGILT